MLTAWLSHHIVELFTMPGPLSASKSELSLLNKSKPLVITQHSTAGKNEPEF